MDDLTVIAELQVEKQRLRHTIRELFKKAEDDKKSHSCAYVITPNSSGITLGHVMGVDCIDQHRSILCTRCQAYLDTKKDAMNAIEHKRRISLRITAACKRVIKKRDEM
jgi:hypothetical protein